MFEWVDWSGAGVATRKLKEQECDRWLRITKLMNNPLHTGAWAEMPGIDLKVHGLW